MSSEQTKRDKAIQLRSDLILRMAMEVFSEKGFYEADVEEIARRANVGKGTVYNYFGNKQQLFLSVVEWGLETLKDLILSATKEKSTFKEKIHKALYTYFEFFEHRKNFFRVLVHEKSNFRENTEKKFTKKYFFHLYLLEEAIQKGIDSCELKRIDSHQCAVMLIGMSNALIYDWFYREIDSRLTDRAVRVEEMFFNGISR